MLNLIKFIIPILYVASAWIPEKHTNIFHKQLGLFQGKEVPP